MDGAPRCFGSAFAFEQESQVCQLCNANGDCEAIALPKRSEYQRQVLSMIHEQDKSKEANAPAETVTTVTVTSELPVVTVTVEPVKPEPVAVPEPGPAVAPEPSPVPEPVKPAKQSPARIPGVNQKGQELLASIAKVTSDLHGEIAAGRDPWIGKKPVFFGFVTAKLVKDGSINRDEMIALFLAKPMKMDSATAHWSLTASALEYLGFERVGNTFKVKR